MADERRGRPRKSQPTSLSAVLQRLPGVPGSALTPEANCLPASSESAPPASSDSYRPSKPAGRTQRDQLHKRTKLITGFAEKLEAQELSKQRTEAIRLARAISLAGLPKRPASKPVLQRTLRLGTATWLRVTYAASPDTELPFGEDRFVLAAIQNLAIEHNTPMVYFEHVGQILRMFGLPESARNLKTLRERLHRLSGLSIGLTFGVSEAELDERSKGEQIFIIRRWELPTRKDLQAYRAGQMSLQFSSTEHPSPYAVQLSADFWEHLREAENQLIVPIDLLKLFLDRPIGWDYLMFLVARCSRARQDTLVDHHVLMSLFKDGKSETDRKAIARLKAYHREILRATGTRLNARIVHLGDFPSAGRGRKKKRWGLRIGPSQPLVLSGKKQILLP